MNSNYEDIQEHRDHPDFTLYISNSTALQFIFGDSKFISDDDDPKNICALYKDGAPLPFFFEDFEENDVVISIKDDYSDFNRIRIYYIDSTGIIYDHDMKKWKVEIKFFEHRSEKKSFDGDYCHFEIPQNSKKRANNSLFINIPDSGSNEIEISSFFYNIRFTIEAKP